MALEKGISNTDQNLFLFVSMGGGFLAFTICFVTGGLKYIVNLITLLMI